LPDRKTAFHSLSDLNKAVVHCELCPRLTKYRELVSEKKRRQFLAWKYWGKPLTGFGDINGALLILGLAPAAHGGNRTGRMFTGDGSAQFLMEGLYKFGFANQPTSTDRHDGLELRNAYMTAIVRCPPPKNKPTPKEIHTCKHYWTEELSFLTETRVILALGRVSFDAYLRFLREQGVETKGFSFRHGAIYHPPYPLPALAASYHPSRQNTQTRKLTKPMFDSILRRIRPLVDAPTKMPKPQS
jgi:uracil-DNA glycosylase family 4